MALESSSFAFPKRELPLVVGGNSELEEPDTELLAAADPNRAVLGAVSAGVASSRETQQPPFKPFMVSS